MEPLKLTPKELAEMTIKTNRKINRSKRRGNRSF